MRGRGRDRTCCTTAEFVSCNTHVRPQSVPFDVTGMPRLTEALLEEGFTPEEVERIMGKNVVRLLRQTLPPETSAADGTAAEDPRSSE